MKELEIGDIVEFTEEFKKATPHSKSVLQRRQKGRIVGFGRKYPGTVRVKWIEGIPEPPKTVESWFVGWLEKCEDEEG